MQKIQIALHAIWAYRTLVFDPFCLTPERNCTLADQSVTHFASISLSSETTCSLICPSNVLWPNALSALSAFRTLSRLFWPAKEHVTSVLHRRVDMDTGVYDHCPYLLWLYQFSMLSRHSNLRESTRNEEFFIMIGLLTIALRLPPIPTLSLLVWPIVRVAIFIRIITYPGHVYSRVV